jgi:hypothetical protein
MVRSKTQPNNHLIYSIDTKVGSCILYNYLSFEEEEPTTNLIADEETMRQTTECTEPKDRAKNEIWNMSFDNVLSKEGVGADVYTIPLKVGTKLSSYKLAFK